MKLPALSCICLSLLLLNACSSGGSSKPRAQSPSSPNTRADTPPKPPTKPPVTIPVVDPPTGEPVAEPTPHEVEPPVEAGVGTGRIVYHYGPLHRNIIAVPDEYWDIAEHHLASGHINILEIGGERIKLIPDQVLLDNRPTLENQLLNRPKLGDFYRENSNRFTKIISYPLQNARYGWLYDKQNEREYFFAHGQPTELAGKHAMPVSGSAKYSGYALHKDHVYRGESRNVQPKQYISRFDVNFGARTVSGGVYVPGGRQVVNIHAHIDGHTFKSPAPELDAINSTTNVQGGFYGANARSMAGVYLDEEMGMQGSFGAGKQ